MENGQSVSQIIKLTTEMEFLLPIYGHIRVLIEESNLGLREGIILYIPDSERRDSVMQIMELCGAVETQLHGNKIPQFANYKMVMVSYQSFYKHEQLMRFLNCREYLPVIIVSGVLPEALKACENIMVLEEPDLNLIHAKRRTIFYERFIDYTHEQVSKILNSIERCSELDEFETMESKRRLYRVLYTVARTYSEYLYDIRIINSFEDISQIMKAFDKNIFQIISNEDDLEDVLPAVRRALSEYLDRNNDILLGAINNIEGDLYSALEQKKAVLYDDEFYYIPDMLLREATSSLQRIVSYSMIKANLCKGEVLICDKSENNYTTKKLLVNAYGAAFRERFLKLKREILDIEGQLSFLERRPICISENVKNITAT